MMVSRCGQFARCGSDLICNQPIFRIPLKLLTLLVRSHTTAETEARFGTYRPRYGPFKEKPAGLQVSGGFHVSDGLNFPGVA